MKQVYNQFLGGLSYYDRNAPANTYHEGREIDPHRGAGYLQPGWLLSTITKSDDATQVIDGAIVDMCFDPSGAKMYFIDDNHLYQMTNIAGTTHTAFNADFDGSAHYYYAIPSASQGYKMIIYNISGTQYLFYAYKKATAGDVGTYDLTSAFNPDFFSTDVTTGKNDLEPTAIDMMEWKSYLYVSHGQYVARYDGANDVLDYHKLDLGKGWEVTKLFPTENFVGICASKKIATSGHSEQTASRIFFWDGISALPTYWKLVDDYDIRTAINKDGEIYLLTWGKDFTGVLRKLTDFGTEKIMKMKTSIDGTLTYYGKAGQNAIDIFGNRVIFGIENLIFSYGKEQEGQPMALTIPWGMPNVANEGIGAIKTALYNAVFIGYYDVTNGVKYILKAQSGNSTRATYRGNYTDMGQTIRVNYIKLYFKPLVASDSVTITLDTDYGTSNTPQQNAGVISHTLDGAITSKKFDLGGIECHSFRPCINWSVGGVAFSKICIDYDFISD